MNRIVTFCFLLLSFYTLPISAQSWESVKSNKEYLWGEGYGSSIAEADENALHDLISKISVSISSDFKVEEEETVTNGNLTSRSTVNNVVQTYSSATLTNTEKLIIENEPDAHVGRFIKRSEIQKIFELRKAKVMDLVDAALRAETQGRADIALRDYYWAHLLLRSLQDPNSVTYVWEEDNKPHVLTNWIIERMDNVFSEIKAEVVKRSGDDVELFFSYRGKPITSVDYNFYDGRDWVGPYSAKDGRGTLELASAFQASAYKLKFEYEYRGQAHIDQEVKMVMDVVKSRAMRNAYKDIPSESSASPKVVAEVAQSAAQSAPQTFSSVPSAIFSKPTAMTNAADYQAKMQSVVNSIKTRNYDAAASQFTSEGLDIYQRLIKYGSGRIMGEPKLVFYNQGEFVSCRGLQMAFSFKSGIRKSFVEEVVFTFDGSKKICNVAFGLDRTAEDDIMGKGVWSEEARFAIVQFLENYQTAYALKRLDYIETIFDDDAVIITGTIAKRNTGYNAESGNIALTNEIVKYNRHTKDSYLKHLRQSFASKEFINLRFADNEVKKLGKGGETYSIQISQDYYSSNYGDHGYLFLMVDINDPQKPIIKVRTWQPEKDPNFGVYGPEDFK